MDAVPNSPPRPAQKPDKPVWEDVMKATPEKVGRVRFKLPDKVDAEEISDPRVLSSTDEYYSSKGLDEPRMNSTYFLQSRISELCQQKEQIKKYSFEQLPSLETYETEVNEKASTALNFKKGSKRYAKLTAIDVNDEDVAALGTKTRIAREVKPQTEVDPSDLMAFFTQDLIIERPALDMETEELEEEAINPPEFSYDFLFELYRSRETASF